MNGFKVGELVVFVGEDPDNEIYTVEIGKIKKMCEDGAFCKLSYRRNCCKN